MDPSVPFGPEPTGGFGQMFRELLGTAGGFMGVCLALFALFFVFVVGTFVWRGVRYLAAHPQQERATCVAKRAHVSGGGMDTGSSTWYHATFQFADGSRRELDLSPRAYGGLAEGDTGMLTWRDTVLRGFEREVRPQLHG